MPKSCLFEPNDSWKAVDVKIGHTVIEVALHAGIAGALADCGGQAVCATCPVTIDEAWLERAGQRTPDEAETKVSLMDMPSGSAYMAKITLDHLVLKVTNFDVSDDFYRRVLGVEVHTPHPDFRFYRLGGQQINVHGPDLVVDPMHLAKTPVTAGNSDIAFEWNGTAEDALAHLRACGVSSHTGIVETSGRRGAGRSVYFRDPDGSLLEFITYPSAE